MSANTLNQAELVFMRYANMGEKLFEETIWNDIKTKLDSSLEIDTELLNLSELVLSHTRSIENELNKECGEWRKLAALLRRLAHKAHRAYGDNRKEEGFLYLV
jgi:hypothetical protein